MVKSIKPTTWPDAVSVVAQHVDFRRTSLVHPDHEDEAKWLRMLQDEMEFICARTYGVELEFPNQNLFDWFTSYTILTLNVGANLKLFDYKSAEEVGAVIEADHILTGGKHLAQMGVDAVLVHLHHLVNEITGWHSLGEANFEGIFPGVSEEACVRALEEMAEWSLCGMLLAWDLWNLPAESIVTPNVS